MNSSTVNHDNMGMRNEYHIYPHITEVKWGYKEFDRLEKFPNLVKFECYSNRIESLEPLREMGNLQKLHCVCNNIEYWEPLRSLVNLQYLNCGYTNIKSLEPLRSLVNLRELDFYGSNIESLEPLKELVNLRVLRCTSNNIKSLEPVRELVNLQELACADTDIWSLEPIRGLVNLQGLFFGENHIKSLEPVRGLINLLELDCGHNRIKSLEPVRELINLQTLFCDNNDIKSLEPLSTLVNLQWLDGDDNNLESLEPLRALTNLKILHFGRNRITSVNPIIYLPRLERIEYDNNPLDPPTVQIIRFLDRLELRHGYSHNVYRDAQNSHNTHIQRCVCDSLQSLLVDPEPDNFTLDTIVHSSLSDHTKQLLTEYCQESTPHSIHLITYQELLSYVWQRIVNSSNPDELFQILEDEIADAECKCFTGRFNRTLSVLVGFYDDIRINISDQSRIGIIISLAEQDVVPYHANDHRTLARQRLIEAGYPEEDFAEWLEYIEE